MFCWVFDVNKPDEAVVLQREDQAIVRLVTFCRDFDVVNHETHSHMGSLRDRGKLNFG